MRKHLLLSALALILPLALPAQQIVKGRIENAPQHKTYMPTFKSDGDTKYPKNIILMIGDGRASPISPAAITPTAAR